MDLSGKQVLVCVTGGIAAYKSCQLVRLFQKAGAQVKVSMTKHATEFVGPVTFRALTNEKVAIDLFDDPTDPIHHISLAQWPDLVVVAPATANMLAKMANGLADDLVSSILLATTAPVLVAPAMNTGMWRAEATQENMKRLRARGVRVVGPGSGYLACGDSSDGRMSEPEEIFDAACFVLANAPQDLAGKNIVITAGPTHEPIDPVRFIGNRSSGKMGIALADAAIARGANVTLVMGPTSIAANGACNVINVQTAQQMYEATVNAFQAADAAICAAAVADYTPSAPSDRKLKKDQQRLDTLQLVETQDILAALSAQKGTRAVIGFAAETNDVLANAQKKILKKGCNAIVANDVSRADSGFGTDTNKAWWVTAQKVEEFPTLSKDELAHQILGKLSDLLRV